MTFLERSSYSKALHQFCGHSLESGSCFIKAQVIQFNMLVLCRNWNWQKIPCQLRWTGTLQLLIGWGRRRRSQRGRWKEKPRNEINFPHAGRYQAGKGNCLAACLSFLKQHFPKTEWCNWEQNLNFHFSHTIQNKVIWPYKMEISIQSKTWIISPFPLQGK